MIDDEVTSTATENQQHLWEHGDVVEFFIQSVGENGYHEYQIAPNGLTLSLFYPDLSSVRSVRHGTRSLEEFLTRAPLETKAWKTPQGWNAAVSIPLAATPGARVRVSCGRYDAGTGRAPILSNISPHPVRDFHRPQDWREIAPVEE